MVLGRVIAAANEFDMVAEGEKGVRKVWDVECIG